MSLLGVSCSASGGRRSLCHYYGVWGVGCAVWGVGVLRYHVDTWYNDVVIGAILPNTFT